MKARSLPSWSERMRSRRRATRSRRVTGGRALAPRTKPAEKIFIGISPRPFPGSDGSTVARIESRHGRRLFPAATGNPNEHREIDEPGSSPDGNSDWLLSHALSRRHRPYSGSTSSNSAQG